MNRTMKRLSLACLFLILIPAILSLSFTQNPQFNSGALVFSDDNLVCSWTYSGDTTAQNITIYQDDVYFTSRNETGGSLNTSFTVSSVNTTKNEVWRCVVVLDNGTSTLSRSVNTTIQNTAPETPTIYNGSNDAIETTYNVTEDTTYFFDVNSSDVDNDTLTYYFKAATQGFCTMSDSSTGNASCTPTQSDHNDSATQVNITFWVDDDDVLFAKSASSKVTFTVIPYNDAPLASVTTQTSPVNQTLTYDIDVTDEEGDSPINFTLVNIPSEISGKTSIVSVDNDTGRFTYDATVPDYNDVNTTGWNITVNITDANNASSLISFLLNLTSVGRAPEIINFTPGPSPAQYYVVAQGGSIQINLTANDSDGNDTHTFSDNAVASQFTTTTTQSLINVSNTTATIDFNATNDDVGTFSVTVTVTDQELITDSIVLNFSVTNVNDAPQLFEQSFDASNTLNNTNMTNITAYADAPLYFAINASDIDSQYGDTLTYSDNSSLFTINPSTGVISFTPNQSVTSASYYSINITVQDNASAVASREMRLWILNNTAPYFVPTPLPSLNCTESVLCTFNLSAYSFEDDVGGSIDLYEASVSGLSSFAYSNSTGLISFTPSQAELGNYTINVTITDDKGAENSTTIALSINNSLDTPVLTRYDFSSRTIVEDRAFSYQLQAQDTDLTANVSENLTLSTNLSFASIGTHTTTLNTTFATLSFTPNSSNVGVHGVNITVTDAYGLQDSQTFTITILADSEAPDIQFIQPYGFANTSYTPNETFINTSFLSDNSTELSFSENNTYTFAHITQDDITSTANLNTTWYYNGVEVATTWNYTRTFNFSSAGTHELQLFVNDSMFEVSVFTWDLTVNDNNRLPLLINNLSDPSPINTTTVITSYLSDYLGTTRFLDPDDDLNGNNELDGSETDSMSYSATACTSGSDTIATISISGPTVTLVPVTVGSCSVLFTALDSAGASLTSESVTINVTGVPEGEEETETTTSSSGGGSSSTRTSFIPLQQEVESPEPINIISPSLVKIYENTSISIPFTVENLWTEDLEFITLSAETNNSEITTIFPSNIIETLAVNESIDLEVIIEDYRLGENYEVEIIANVSDPSFVDTALVIIASLESSSEGDNAKIKVTFARDLFNEQPDCQELTELLDRSEEELARGNTELAKKYADDAINGCKYLVSTLQQHSEQPSAIPNFVSLDELTLETIFYSLLALLVVGTIGFIIFYHYTSRDEDDI